MTQAQIIQEIQTWIVTNGNNEITANVLQPILVEMVNQPNTLIGDLSGLNTANKNNLVEAINEVIGNMSSGVTIYAGEADPNVTPPPVNFSIANFYQRIVNGNTIGLYIFNGVNWFLLASEETSGVVRSGKVLLNDYVVEDGDHTLIYLDNTPVNVFMPAASAVNEGRELRLVNQSTEIMTLDVDIRTKNGLENEVAAGTSVFLLAVSGTWYKIN